MLTIQYLEASPALVHLDRKQVVDLLCAAADRLPLTHLLIGWNVPVPILEACRMEAERLGMRFLAWQPLLTLDPDLQPDPQWRMVDMFDNRLVGYRGLPEFTFCCPNHPAVQEALCRHLERLARLGLYQGFFLDRIRFPSPAGAPLTHLGCFCEYCQLRAMEVGLDLRRVKSVLGHLSGDENTCTSLVKSLLSWEADPDQADPAQCLSQFLSFRNRSIHDFLAVITPMLREAGLEIGLDCYSPSLTRMVGQDLTSLSGLVDWIKLMTYAHTYAPAGLPFELSGLAKSCALTTGRAPTQVLRLMADVTGLPLAQDLVSLESRGLSSQVLATEVAHGARLASVPVLAGVELVDIPGVTRLNTRQIRSDLSALQQTKISGLSISWDLLKIPLGRLDLVRQVFFPHSGD